MPKKQGGKDEETEESDVYSNAVRRTSRSKPRRWRRLFETVEEERADEAKRVALISQLL